MYTFLLPLLLTVANIHAMHWFERKPLPKYQKVKSVPTTLLPLPCLSFNEQVKNNMFYCPKPDELYLKDNIWHTKDGWKSYEVSFATAVTSFSGAQWQGYNVGRVICLYTGEQQNDFPVQITMNSLVHAPTKPVWQNIKENYNCVSVSGNVCDCPFSYVKTKHEDIDEVIKQLN